MLKWRGWAAAAAPLQRTRWIWAPFCLGFQPPALCTYSLFASEVCCCPLPRCEPGWRFFVVSVAARWIPYNPGCDKLDWSLPTTCQLHASPRFNLLLPLPSASHTRRKECSAVIHTCTALLGQDGRVLSPPQPSFPSLLTWRDGVLQPRRLPKCTFSLILWEFGTKLRQCRCHLAVWNKWYCKKVYCWAVIWTPSPLPPQESLP